MRAISAALVLLSGAIMILAAFSPGVPNDKATGCAITGGVVGLVGLVCWLLAFFYDRDRA